MPPPLLRRQLLFDSLGVAAASDGRAAIRTPAQLLDARVLYKGCASRVQEQGCSTGCMGVRKRGRLPAELLDARALCERRLHSRQSTRRCRTNQPRCWFQGCRGAVQAAAGPTNLAGRSSWASSSMQEGQGASPLAAQAAAAVGSSSWQQHRPKGTQQRPAAAPPKKRSSSSSRHPRTHCPAAARTACGGSPPPPCPGTSLQTAGAGAPQARGAS